MCSEIFNVKGSLRICIICACNRKCSSLHIVTWFYRNMTQRASDAVPQISFPTQQRRDFTGLSQLRAAPKLQGGSIDPERTPAGRRRRSRLIDSELCIQSVVFAATGHLNFGAYRSHGGIDMIKDHRSNINEVPDPLLPFPPSFPALVAEVTKSGVKRLERECRRGSSCVPGKPLPGFGGDVAFSARRRAEEHRHGSP